MQIEEILNKTVWEEFIQTCSPQSLFQSWNWGEIIKTQKNNQKGNGFWRFGFYDGKKLVGIAQVEKIVAKRGTYLHVRHGPILKQWSDEYFGFILRYLVTLGRENKAWFIRLSPLILNNTENRSLFNRHGCRDSPIHAMDGELCWVLDLNADEVMLANMRKTTRYLIRQAQKLNVKIVKSRDKKELAQFLSLYHRTANRHQFIEHKGIEDEYSTLLADNQVLMFLGYYQEKLLAAALIVFYNNQAIYHHSASIDQKIPVNYLLQWEAILEAKRRGKSLYNFWGIAPENKPNHPWKGLSLFKKGFGGRSVEYLHAKDLPLSPKYYATYIIELIRKIRKGY